MTSSQTEIAMESGCLAPTDAPADPGRLHPPAGPHFQPFDAHRDVYLSSAELAAIAALLGRIPTVDEYMKYVADLDTMSDEIYRYLNFNEIENFQFSADSAKVKFKDIAVNVQMAS